MNEAEGGKSTFRRIAREAVIFMLLGLALSSVGAFIYMHHDQAKSIQAQHDALKKECDSIGSWMIGVQPFGGRYTSEAECSLVFGEKLYPPHPYNAGVTLSQESIQQDADALAEGQRIKDLKVDYGECAIAAAVGSGFGFVGGFGIWLFYRLVRFAVKG